jgi:TRAP-type mannitol/chloroaromatic compound transport system substrate-binding protein
MTKRTLKTVSVVVLLIALIFVPSSPVVAKVIKWKAATVWTPAITLIKADQYFVKTLNELCKGELEVKLYPAPQIVSSFEVFGAVQSGVVKIGFDWPGYWAGKDTAFGALGALPCGPGQMDLMTWIIKGGGDKVAMDVFEKHGMLYFFHTVLPPESGLRGKKTFTNREDFKGAKIRMSGMFQGKILQDLGASQVMLAGQEIYQALEKGVIDAAEFSTPDNDWSLGFQEVTSVWNSPAWHQPASPMGLMINRRAWDQLPPHIQQKFKVAATATLAWGLAHYNYDGSLYAKKFMDKGVTVNYLDDAVMEEIQNLSYNHIVEEAEKNPTFAKVVYSIFSTMDVLSNTRDKELGLLSRKVILPDMEKLRQAAAK